MHDKQTPKLAPSREVRLEDGVLEGEIERVAFDIYTSGTDTLAHSIVKLELLVELQRSKAVEGFAELLRRKLLEDGYIVVSDINKAAHDWHEGELIFLDDYRPEEPGPIAA